MRYIQYLLEILLIVAALCCGHSTESSNDNWKSLGFLDKFAIRLVLSEPYLYVCAGSDGLWRLDISTKSSINWEYMGLADTSLGDYLNRGVLDVVPNLSDPNTMIVAYATGKAVDHGVFKSEDGGITWVPSDSGMEVELNDEIYYSHPHKFIKYPSQIVSSGTQIFSSDDFGKSWINKGIVWGPVTGVATNALKYHPKKTSNIWIGGESVYFGPILLFSLDTGNSWDFVDLGKIIPVDNAVFSIAFDPEDENIIYVGMQGAIIKSNDGGQSWIVPLFTNGNGNNFRAIESDPQNQNHLWASSGSTIVEPIDGGITWKEIPSPIEFKVLDMLWDDMARSLYLATEHGIYLFRR